MLSMYNAECGESFVDTLSESVNRILFIWMLMMQDKRHDLLHGFFC